MVPYNAGKFWLLKTDRRDNFKQQPHCCTAAETQSMLYRKNTVKSVNKQNAKFNGFCKSRNFYLPVTPFRLSVVSKFSISFSRISILLHF